MCKPQSLPGYSTIVSSRSIQMVFFDRFSGGCIQGEIQMLVRAVCIKMTDRTHSELLYFMTKPLGSPSLLDFLFQIVTTCASSSEWETNERISGQEMNEWQVGGGAAVLMLNPLAFLFDQKAAGLMPIVPPSHSSPFIITVCQPHALLAWMTILLSQTAFQQMAFFRSCPAFALFL